MRVRGTIQIVSRANKGYCTATELCCCMLFYFQNKFSSVAQQLAWCTKLNIWMCPSAAPSKRGQVETTAARQRKRRTCFFFLLWVQTISLYAEIGLQSFDLHSKLATNVWQNLTFSRINLHMQKERLSLENKRVSEGINLVTLRDQKLQSADGHINLSSFSPSPPLLLLETVVMSSVNKPIDSFFS